MKTNDISKTASHKPNRLAKEKSPYLLQHAYNPVDWYPWGKEAFERARTENKPIFLSVGYSTCHWCHVMEHESFENEEIAAVMNKHFVCIKVDREERPDVDKIYMTAVQAMTGSGGWPMSVFLTPDLKPFFGGTYWPPTAKYGRAGFKEILERVHEVWEQKHEDVLKSSEQLGAQLEAHMSVQSAPGSLDDHTLTDAYHEIANQYDETYGGFGNAPKFPRPVSLNFLVRYHARAGDKKALEMVQHTLKKMALGGMYDQLGGGFHRYSVDQKWLVPHFEKMLYDNAQLVCSYLEAYQITRDPFYADVARDVLRYVMRDMTHKGGGWYSAEDADSEGVEGKFYVWTLDEVNQILGPDDAKVLSFVYEVSSGGNFEHGWSILNEVHSVKEAAGEFKKNDAEIKQILAHSKGKLFAVRSKRIRPHLDDKILTAWNGLMLSAFARAHQVLDDRQYLDAALKNAGWVWSNLYDAKTHRLHRRWREGEVGGAAILDDYAFLIQGLIDLYEASFDPKWLTRAIELQETQNKLFYDAKDSGFFMTTGEDASILSRPKEDYDGAEPSGNSISVLNLLRLAQFTDNAGYREMADKTLHLFGERLRKIPQVAPQMLVALDFSLQKPKQIVIAGKPGAADTKAMLHAIHERFVPARIVILIDGGTAQAELAKALPFLRDIAMKDGKATAYVCVNYACQLPVTDVEKLKKQLDGTTK
ncbi:MAG: thioredoxin domain-containing protein [Verrucomicrobiae bacterium]|nr:thioredoxin domain-containing protein [Verrucomicrobiae bacterium]